MAANTNTGAKPKKPAAAPNPAAARLKIEINDLLKNKDFKKCGYKLELVDEANMTELKGEIFGPPDSPYEGGHFCLSIKIPEEYPFKAPGVKFLTRIWHPNISSQTGTICLNILKPAAWSAALNIRTVMITVQALLTSPVPDDALDAVVGRQHLGDIAMFNKTAKYWTSVYANGPAPDEELQKNVDDLVKKGFFLKSVIDYLSTYNWDVRLAESQLNTDSKTTRDPNAKIAPAAPKTPTPKATPMATRKSAVPKAPAAPKAPALTKAPATKPKK